MIDALKNILRPKEVGEEYDTAKHVFTPPSASDCGRTAKDVIEKWDIVKQGNKTEMEAHVLHDSHMETWVRSLPKLHGTQEALWKVFSNPIHDKDALTARQDVFKSYNPSTNNEWGDLQQYEPDVMWALKLPAVDKTWPLPLLFPQWFGLRWINKSPLLLDLYHFYRMYFLPSSHLLYPLTLIIGPWWYVRTKMKWEIPFKMYLNLVKQVVWEMVRVDSRFPKQVLAKIITLCVYGGLYLYGLIQSVDLSIMIRTIRKQLMTRLRNIHAFISKAKALWSNNSEIASNLMAHWNLPTELATVTLSKSFQGVFELFKGTHKATFGTLLRQVYVLEMASVISTFIRSGTYCMVQWGTTTKFYGAGHPCLPKDQQRNPCSLAKNIIITGPNAAGKTSYARSILANSLLAQSFGIAFATKAVVQPVQMMSSFMRIGDVIGSYSLFEAECDRCKEMMNKAQLSLKQNSHVLLFLDEPMHATPPIEGAATTMALLKSLSNYPNVRTVTTTHYHSATQLQTLHPERFVNVSMEAQIHNTPDTMPSTAIQFTYLLSKGPSFQSIAIEMLKKEAFLPNFIDDAIEFKNKICRIDNK